MKKLFLLCVTMIALAAANVLHAQAETKGAVMAIRVCDYDTANSGDTSLLGYVFMEQHELDESLKLTVYCPSMEDVRMAEKLLRSKYTYIMPAEKRDKLGRETRPRLKSYKRQYVFGVDNEGKKYAWVNGISAKEIDDWLGERLDKGIIHVRDGGNSFWQVLLNISDGKVLYGGINGEA